MERSWITQEAVVNPSITVQSGAYSLFWEQMQDAIYTHMEYGVFDAYDDVVDNRSWTKFQQLTMIRVILPYQSNVHPSDVAPLMRNTQCTDQRDKVYALLGILSPSISQHVGVSYQLPWPEVYSRATHTSMVAEGNLNILFHVDLKSHTAGLPSWTVDFGQNGRLSTEWFPDMNKAFRFSRGPDRFRPQISADSRKLMIAGRVLDHVDHRCNLENRLKFDDEPFSEPVKERFIEMLDSALKRISRSSEILPNIVCSSWVHGPEAQVTLQAETFRRYLIGPGTSRGLIEQVYEFFRIWDRAYDVHVISNERLLAHLAAYFDESERGCTFFTTKRGLIGPGVSLDENSLIAWIPGSGLPVVLTPKGDYFTFSGFAYMHRVVIDASPIPRDYSEERRLAIPKMIDCLWQYRLEENEFMLA